VFRTAADSVLFDEGDKISPQQLVELPDEVTRFLFPTLNFSTKN
jgi:hypothetical protein